ncbi:PIN domain-containing protein [Candidatus Woesearchaeota archaeon]|nr:PIN domain-containing protein [Candidatus Woesearchaeota archaeon]
MSKLIMDAYAWIEYLEGSPQGKQVHELIKIHEIITHEVTVAEVVSRITRKGLNGELAYEAMKVLSKIMSTDPLFSKEVGLLHANLRKKISDFGLADAYVLYLAITSKGSVVTGDPHFKNMKNVIFLK